MVFGVSLSQCIENERLNRNTSSNTFKTKSSTFPDDSNLELKRKSHHGSRTSFSSLIEPRPQDEVCSPTLQNKLRRNLFPRDSIPISCSVVSFIKILLQQFARLGRISPILQLSLQYFQNQSVPICLNETPCCLNVTQPIETENLKT